MRWRGGSYRRVGVPEPVLTENVWLAGYRQPRSLDIAVAGQLLTVFADRRELMDGAADELTALGHAVSRMTIRRRRAAYAASGLWGMVDQRTVREGSPTGRVDERVVAAARQALAEQVDTSTGTRGRVRRRVVQLLSEEHGPGVVAIPPASTFYRLLSALDTGGHPFGAATTRRSLANRPDGPFGTVGALRPGQPVLVDTTPLDVMAVLDNGVTGRVELTTLLDLATRTL